MVATSRALAILALLAVLPIVAVSPFSPPDVVGNWLGYGPKPPEPAEPVSQVMETSLSKSPEPAKQPTLSDQPRPELVPNSGSNMAAGERPWQDPAEPMSANFQESPYGPFNQGSGVETALDLRSAERNSTDFDPFSQFDGRLRDLGVEQYRMEHWGTDGSWYRFSCRAAVSGDAGCTRHFEAVESRPLEAIEVVLKAVQTWRAAQQEPRIGQAGPCQEAGVRRTF